MTPTIVKLREPINAALLLSHEDIRCLISCIAGLPNRPLESRAALILSVLRDYCKEE